MNERQQSHLDYYLQRLEHWKGRKPTDRLLAARDADEAHPDVELVSVNHMIEWEVREPEY